MRYFLGIDGGGSRTIAWLADERRRILARSVAGPSNPLKVGLSVSQRHLIAAARHALRQARVRSDGLEAVCAGVAGVDRASIYQKLMPGLREAIAARHYLLTTDAAIALECALGNSAGIIVISGTGSIAYGRDGQGSRLRCGGWGSVFDDAGSGYDLGRKAIMAALRDLDGRGPPTRLGRDICKALKIRTVFQVVMMPLAPHQVAALFPCVLEAARAGDRVARQLCQGAGRDLAELALALLQRLDQSRRPLPVVCAGGVFHASLSVRRSFARHLRRAIPEAGVSLLRREAVEGALALAEALAGKAARESTGTGSKDVPDDE